MKFTICDLRFTRRLAHAESGAEATAVQTLRAIWKCSVVAQASGLRRVHRRFSTGSTMI
jgi:hypothetical protein